MGIFVKNNHGTDYLYALAGKSQFFLGRKDDPDGLNLNNLRKATKITDQNFNRSFDHYIEDVKEYSSYLPEPEKRAYVSKRHNELLFRLKQLTKPEDH